MTLLLGAHMSIKDGIESSIAQAVTQLQANAMQIFLRSPRGGVAKPIPEDVGERCRALVKENKMFLIAHSAYYLNFAVPYKSAPWGEKIFADDIRRCDFIGGSGVVLHMGKSTEPVDDALDTMADNIKRVFDDTPESSVPILLENMAGQGTEFGYQFEVIAELMKLVGKTARLKMCFDTAHAFAAGYDFVTEAGWKKTCKELEATVGWERVVNFHLNDSKVGLGSRVDRHENIGKGMIGKAGITRVAKYAKSKSIPMILETPLGDDEQGHIRDMKTVRSLLS